MSVERIYYEQIQKLESKLKMMEISFEQINNSRNDLIKQLTDSEMLNKRLKKDLENTINQLDMRNGSIDNLKEKLEEIKKLTFHAGCNGNPNCVLCPIVKILGDQT